MATKAGAAPTPDFHEVSLSNERRGAFIHTNYGSPETRLVKWAHRGLFEEIHHVASSWRTHSQAWSSPSFSHCVINDLCQASANAHVLLKILIHPDALA